MGIDMGNGGCMKKGLLVLVLVFALMLAACGGPKLKDGTYTHQSTPDESGGYTDVTLTIQDGKIVACEQILYDNEGKVKDESYGKLLNENLYKVAQAAVKAAGEYPEALIKTQDIDQVDAISGATQSHALFVECVKVILERATEK